MNNNKNVEKPQDIHNTIHNNMHKMLFLKTFWTNSFRKRIHSLKKNYKL